MTRRRSRALLILAIAVTTLVIGVLLVGREGDDRRTASVATSTSTSSSQAMSSSIDDPSTTATSAASPSSQVAPPSTAGAAPTPQNARTGVEPEAVEAVEAAGTARVMVSLDLVPSGDDAQRAAQVKASLDRVVATLPPGSYSGVPQGVTVPVVSLTVDRAGLDALGDAATVTSVRASRRFTPAVVTEESGPASLAPSSQSATTAMGASAAWAAGKKGAGATVAVVDSGVDRSHPFLTATAKTIKEACFFTDDATWTSTCPSGVSMALDADPVPDSARPCAGLAYGCEHGTHVAGIAVGGTATTGVSGVAPEANLIAVQVFGYEASTNTVAAFDPDIADALQWLYNKRASFPGLASVTLSLGHASRVTGYCNSDPLKSYVDQLANVGITVVVAAGNRFWTNGVTAPGCIESVITVGAVDDSTGGVASFSNNGPQVELLAPGVNICSSVPSGSGASTCSSPNGGAMQAFDGTSMSVPAVAGAIAVMKGAGIASSEWRTRLLRVPSGGDCVQAGVYAVPSLRVDVALGLTAQRAAPCAPGAPSATLTGFNANSATVTWLAPVSTGTSALKSFTATASTGQSCVVVAPAVTCTVTNIPWSTTVGFSVSATSNTGTSGASVLSATLATASGPTVTTAAPTTTAPPATSPPTTVAPTPSTMIPVTPARLADTRSVADGASTVDGQYQGRGAVPAGTAYPVRVLGRGGVPWSGVGAVALNVTATNPSTAGFLTVYPSGAPRPTASSLNFTWGQTVPNLVISGVGSDASVAVFNALGSVDVIVDVVGWYPSSGGYVALQPARVLETRGGLSTVDGQYNGGGAVPQGAAVSLVVAGRGGVPANAGSVVLNVTATNPTAPGGFLTVYPRGAPLPTASNLNFGWGQTVANSVITAVGDAGRVEIFNALGSTDVIVDVVGWMPAGGQYHAMNPARLLETRGGLSTADGQYNGTGALAPGAALPLQVAGRAGIPVGARAVVVNVTAANPTWWGFFTVYSSSSSRPTASNLNFSPGQTVPNLVICGVGGDGRIVLFNALGTTDAIVDVVGWYS